jgi:hypothetical protein
MIFRSSFFAISLFGVFVVTFLAFWYQGTNMSDTASEMLFPRVVFADEDEEEDEEDEEEDEEDDDDDDDREDSSASRSVRSKETVITTYRLVQKTVTVLDEKFRVDTDGDLLVDGLDPHPAVPESEYFTDDDEDAVPNAVDAYPGEDDFLVFDDGEDRDKDGILDSFAAAVSKEME